MSPLLHFPAWVLSTMLQELSDNGCHLLSPYSVPGTERNARQDLTHPSRSMKPSPFSQIWKLMLRMVCISHGLTTNQLTARIPIQTRSLQTPKFLTGRQEALEMYTCPGKQSLSNTGSMTGRGEMTWSLCIVGTGIRAGGTRFHRVPKNI